MTRKTTQSKIPIGLAVSGGADSTALLVSIAEHQKKGELGNAQFVVLHVDHGLRPDSGADAKFVQKLAQRYGFKCIVHKTRVRKQKGESLEMAARRVRLAFFERQTKRLGLFCIMTAHTLNDVAETFLMRLARGSGAEGLAGIKETSAVGAINFVRPLLHMTHEELKIFLTQRNIVWREDATNNDTSILRNKVRHVILPFLEKELDPKIIEHIGKSAAILRGDLSKPVPPPPSIPTPKPKPETYTLTISPHTGFAPTVQATPTGRGGRPRPPATRKLDNSQLDNSPTAYHCFMSRQALAGRTLKIRYWQPGDAMKPFGLKGHSRKLQDIFVTSKIPEAQRHTIPLIVDANTDEILWLPTYRIAQSVAVKSQYTPSWHLQLNREQ